MKYIMHYSALALLCFSLSLSAQTNRSLLHKELKKHMANSQLPGFAVSLVGKTEIVFQEGFGYADLETQKPFSPQTVLNIGSITKVFIGMAILHAQKKGQLSFHTPLNEVLPFQVVNPNHPDIPLTIWHLVTHTAGIRDTRYYNQAYLSIEETTLSKKEVDKWYWKEYKRQRNNKRVSMGSFLEQYLSTNGEAFHKNNFRVEKPGTHYHYSNIGATLAAYILELATGESFADYTTEHILKPLGMYQSTWQWKNVNPKDKATLYWYDRKPFPTYELITYPDGGLITSVNDLALFTQEILNGYEGNGQLLDQAAYRTMLDVQFEGGDNPGVFWDNLNDGWRGHGGGDPGIHTLLLLNPKKGIGRICVTNIYADYNEQLKEAFRKIFWQILPKYENQMLLTLNPK